MDLAAAERLRLCDLFDTLGPDAPTLCEGWTTRDLAAHLVVRERQPLAGPGLLVPAAAGISERLRQRAAQRPYDELVRLVRSGPPALSPLGLPWLREAANLHEFYVHHEDVRRPAGGGARHDSPELDDPLWRRLRSAGRLFTRRVSGAAVHVLSRDGASFVARGGRGPVVTVTGTPRELTVFFYNRKDAAEVDLSGDPVAVTALRAARLGL